MKKILFLCLVNNIVSFLFAKDMNIELENKYDYVEICFFSDSVYKDFKENFSSLHVHESQVIMKDGDELFKIDFDSRLTKGEIDYLIFYKILNNRIFKKPINFYLTIDYGQNDLTVSFTGSQFATF